MAYSGAVGVGALEWFLNEGWEVHCIAGSWVSWVSGCVGAQVLGLSLKFGTFTFEKFEVSLLVVIAIGHGHSHNMYMHNVCMYY